MNTIKKSAVALLLMSVVGLSAAPMIQAKSNVSRERNSHEFELEDGHGSNRGPGRGLKLGIENEHGVLSGLGLENNTAVMAARDTFKTAVKNAKDAFKTAVQAARTKLTSALTAAGTNANARLAAVRTYLTEVLSAKRQQSAARETALQNFITALSNITITQ